MNDLWEVQILFCGQWTTLTLVEGTVEDAEWIVGTWKQENRCYGDPFRVVDSVQFRRKKAEKREPPPLLSKGGSV